MLVTVQTRDAEDKQRLRGGDIGRKIELLRDRRRLVVELTEARNQGAPDSPVDAKPISVFTTRTVRLSPSLQNHTSPVLQNNLVEMGTHPFCSKKCPSPVQNMLSPR